MTTASIAMTIEPASDAWAYPDIEADHKARRYVWREVTEDFADQALDSVPPIFVRGGFLVGEAWSHNANGEPLYAAFATVGERHFATICTFAGFAARRAWLARAL